MESSISRTNLNCISLADSDIQKSVAHLKQACVDSGFFYVVDHGISHEFMDEVFAQSRKFFCLPHNEKMKLLRNEKNRGYTPMLDEILDPENQVNGDYKEGYYIGVEVPADNPQASRPFYGPNQWPSEEVLPKWREVMEQYHREALFMEKPTVMHYKTVKQILRYLKGTVHYGLVYTREEREQKITGYTDSDLAGDMDDSKSTGGMAFYINDSLVLWNSQKQKMVALSSCETEFMAATMAACQALWLRSLLGELTGEEPKAVKLFVDNKSVIALMKNPVFHGRSKYIDTRFHFIRECVERGQIE